MFLRLSFRQFSIITSLIVLFLINICYATEDDTKNTRQEIWEQDLGDQFKIDASTDGLQKVHLKCGAESMQIELETEDDFNGVMYTRGSFHKQSEPCFVKANDKRKSKRSLHMKFSFNNCQTIQNGNVYTNVVVVQHDPELVTPGDAAFALECDFRKPRNLKVDANFQANDSGSSRITLISPDPSSISTSNLDHADNQNSIFNQSNSVTFTPLAPSTSHSSSSSDTIQKSKDDPNNNKKKTNNKQQKVKGTVETITLDRTEQRQNDEL